MQFSAIFASLLLTGVVSAAPATSFESKRDCTCDQGTYHTEWADCVFPYLGTSQQASYEASCASTVVADCGDCGPLYWAKSKRDCTCDQGTYHTEWANCVFPYLGTSEQLSAEASCATNVTAACGDCGPLYWNKNKRDCTCDQGTYHTNWANCVFPYLGTSQQGAEEASCASSVISECGDCGVLYWK
ncbi:uncharacterized protein LY89DRAFT_734728 [Mollisia scopiformis]|uniref:Uncharacterized protein n=1 Tax=Mollisia scopiformis TaxID=149040 RepID=A0A194X8Y7_MOLSC|nr:uncharacterized protein LY89DRAFT_734728 [Mollisia scopiformis]KUJ16633.1 hypothetical protein LY89DRAFT_734728 [Mollisia scopiformis]